MRYLIAMLCALALVAAACAPAPTPEPAPVPVPVPEPEPVVVEENVMTDDTEIEEIDSGLDKAFGAVDESQIITADDIVCDSAAKTLSIRFRNVEGEASWQLNQDLPFPPPKGMATVRLIINQYEANKRGGYYRGGELLFGPSETFSENCGGVEVLAPGEEVSCDLTNVPLKEETGNVGDINEVYVDTPGQGARVRFTC